LYNCVPDLGYSCTGSVGSTSSCAIRCGDGIRGSTEQCDNGNRTGCLYNCVVDSGYQCTGYIGSTSSCTLSIVCGNSIR
jgi:cysteine-rich repeat protein